VFSKIYDKMDAKVLYSSILNPTKSKNSEPPHLFQS